MARKLKGTRFMKKIAYWLEDWWMLNPRRWSQMQLLRLRFWKMSPKPEKKKRRHEKRHYSDSYLKNLSRNILKPKDRKTRRVNRPTRITETLRVWDWLDSLGCRYRNGITVTAMALLRTYIHRESPDGLRKLNSIRFRHNKVN